MPRLSRRRLFHLAQFAQQVEVLHVARADLEDVDVGQHKLDLRDLHDLADHEQVELVARFAQQLEAFEAEALERVRRDCAA